MSYLEAVEDSTITWVGGVPTLDVAPPGEPPAPEPAPGSPDFTGPVLVADDGAGAGSAPYTLPVEIFNGVLPPIVIQAGGVPTIPSPIPDTLPSTTVAVPPAPNYPFYVALAALAAIALLPSNKAVKKRRKG